MAIESLQHFELPAVDDAQPSEAIIEDIPTLAQQFRRSFSTLRPERIHKDLEERLATFEHNRRTVAQFQEAYIEAILAGAELDTNISDLRREKIRNDVMPYRHGNTVTKD